MLRNQRRQATEMIICDEKTKSHVITDGQVTQETSVVSKQTVIHRQLSYEEQVIQPLTKKWNYWINFQHSMLQNGASMAQASMMLDAIPHRHMYYTAHLLPLRHFWRFLEKEELKRMTQNQEKLKGVLDKLQEQVEHAVPCEEEQRLKEVSVTQKRIKQDSVDHYRLLADLELCAYLEYQVVYDKPCNFSLVRCVTLKVEYVFQNTVKSPLFGSPEVGRDPANERLFMAEVVLSEMDEHSDTRWARRFWIHASVAQFLSKQHPDTLTMFNDALHHCCEFLQQLDITHMPTTICPRPVLKSLEWSNAVFEVDISEPPMIPQGPKMSDPSYLAPFRAFLASGKSAKEADELACKMRVKHYTPAAKRVQALLKARTRIEAEKQVKLNPEAVERLDKLQAWLIQEEKPCEEEQQDKD